MRGVTLRNAIVRGYLASLAVLVAAVAVFTYGATEERLSAGVRREVIAYARAAALEVDRTGHARAAASRDWDAPEYLAEEARLRALRDAWRASGIPVRFVFTLVMDRASPSGAAYVVDAAERGPDKSKPGEAMRFFEREGDAVDWRRTLAIQYTDAYGTFFSGFAPVLAPDGSVEFVAGIDLDAAEVQAAARHAAFDAAWPVALVGVVLLAAFAWYVHRMVRPVAAVEALAAELDEQVPGAAAVGADMANALRSRIAAMRAELDRAVQAARHAEEASARLETRAADREREAEAVAAACGDGARRARGAAEGAGGMATGAREAEASARAASESGANALGDAAQIDAGVQSVIVRGRDIAQSFAEMRERAATVDAALEAMIQVANRSSVLSLNAEIEASLAGDAGRGFSVVAREIRRLAEEAARNSLEIERNVRALHESLDAGKRATDEFAEVAEEASARSIRLSASMADGIQRIQSIVPQVHELGERGDRLQREAQELADALRAAEATAGSVATHLAQAIPALRDLRAASARAAGMRG